MSILQSNVEIEENNGDGVNLVNEDDTKKNVANLYK